MTDRFTDYVLSIEGPYDEDAWDYLENEVLPALQRIVKLDVGLSSHECNDDGDTYHSLLTRNEILAERLEEVLAERTALQAAVRNELNRD
jgi:hypothetical protein